MPVQLPPPCEQLHADARGVLDAQVQQPDQLQGLELAEPLPADRDVLDLQLLLALEPLELAPEVAVHDVLAGQVLGQLGQVHRPERLLLGQVGVALDLEEHGPVETPAGDLLLVADQVVPAGLQAQLELLAEQLDPLLPGPQLLLQLPLQGQHLADLLLPEPGYLHEMGFAGPGPRRLWGLLPQVL